MLNAKYQLENCISLVARINNLFDEKYEEYVGYWNNISQYTPATGRNYSVEINYTF
ncbi:TonB-dependent receptor [Fusobacterium varium]|nr:TonB-dependent receptor [Fusobacterium ulcerans]